MVRFLNKQRWKIKNIIIGFWLSASIFLFMGKTVATSSLRLQEIYDIINDISIDVKDIKKSPLEALDRFKIWK